MDGRSEEGAARWRFWVVGFACLAVALLLVWRGAYQYRSLWCSKCGLLAHEEGLTLGSSSGKPILRRMRYYETAFYRLHRRFVSASCRHEWRWTSCGGRGLFRGLEYGRGGRHPVLGYPYDQGLHTVERLAPPERARAVLAVTDLEPPYRHRGAEAVMDAIEEISTGATPSEMDAWWRKHQGLFAVAQAGRAGNETR